MVIVADRDSKVACSTRLPPTTYRRRSRVESCSSPVFGLLAAETREHCSHVAVDGSADAAVPVTAATAGEASCVGGTATTTDPHVEGRLEVWLGGGLGFGK